MKDLIKNILLEMDFSFVDEIDDDSIIPGSELKPNDKFTIYSVRGKSLKDMSKYFGFTGNKSDFDFLYTTDDDGIFICTSERTQTNNPDNCREGVDIDVWLIPYDENG